MTLINHNPIYASHQRFFEFFFDKPNIYSYEILRECLLQYRDLALAENTYNYLTGGRVGYLLTLCVFYDNTSDERIKKIIVEILNSIKQDAFFLKEKLTWLPVYHTNNEHKRIFLRNIGIYLGLKLINQYFIDDESLETLSRHISFEVELGEVSSIKHRKMLQRMLISDTESIKTADIETLLTYHQNTHNQVVLEAIICILITNQSIINESLVNRTKEYIKQYEHGRFIIALIELVLQKQVKKRTSLNLSGNFTEEMMQKNFSSVYQFCGEDTINKIIREQQLEKVFSPSLWLKNILKFYPNKSLLFKNVIWREQFLLNSPTWIFSINKQPDYDLAPLHQCYNSNIDKLFEFKLKINKSKFEGFFGSFWIGILPIKDFRNLNIEKKIVDFRQTQQYSRFTILLAKRFEKIVTWQGRSFRDNDEIDFIFFFLNDFRSLNDYKNTFGEKALSDFKIIELTFWCLEIGIIQIG